MYRISEKAGLVRIVLVLSMALSTDIAVQIRDSEGTATSEYICTTNKQD